MSDPTIGPNAIEEYSDLGTGDEALYAYWMGQERIAEKEEGNWPKRARAIVNRYRDERPEAIRGTHRFNILWSNVQTLMPALYARTPKPDVERRFKDQDDTGRLAATLLERCLSYSLDCTEDESDFDAVIKAVVEDKLLPGRGTARVLYVPHFGDEIEDEFADAEVSDVVVAGPGDKPEPLRKVVGEEALPSYVFWEDYREGPARTWREVPWVRYRAYMTRDELIKRFGRKKGKRVNLDYAPSDSHRDKQLKDAPPDIYKKATVHEVWDKSKLRVIWYAPATPDLILDEVDDPLGLPGFFPSPNPLFGTTTNNKRIPVPDFIEYQDQAIELDNLTGRIDKLTQALKVSGVYPGSSKQVLQQLIDQGTENRLIPVEDWMAFVDKGGLANMIQWMPIKEIAETLIRLYDARDRVKQMLYEITGIGDIIRGDTQPDETATAQRLKSNFVTRRISPKQKEVARFARDMLRLMAAVIAGHFSAETISKITGYPQLLPVPALPPAPPQFLPPPMPQQQPMGGAPPPPQQMGQVA